MEGLVTFVFLLIKILSVCIICPDSFSGYYEKRGRADGPEGPDYGPEGRFSGPQSHKDMFYGPLARKHDQKFIQMVDRAFELYRVSLNLIFSFTSLYFFGLYTEQLNGKSFICLFWWLIKLIHWLKFLKISEWNEWFLLWVLKIKIFCMHSF